MKKGVFEFEVSGQKRGFKFGTLALGITEREEQTTLDQVFIRAGFNGDSPSVMTLLNLFYGAAVQYSEDKGEKVDFKKSNVSDWLDELGFEKVHSILADGMTPYVPKKNLMSLTGSLTETPSPLQTSSISQ
jgi:hypothetical protein